MSQSNNHLNKQGQPVYDMDILKPRFDEEGAEKQEQEQARARCQARGT